MSEVNSPKTDDWKTPWWYHLFGYWIRRDACRLAAMALRDRDTEDGYVPRLWSLTVFFESYLVQGSDATHKDFGPKDPVSITEAK